MIQLFIRKVAVRARRVVWRILAARHPQKIHSFTLPDGGRFDYPLASAIGADLFAGWFEPAEVAFVRQHIQPGDVVLDVGANAGLYTVLAARAVGRTGRVFAFEPDDRALALLRRNIELNRLDNVTVIEGAVSNETGERQFAAASDIAMSSLAATERADQQIQAWRTVKTIRLDDAVETFHITGASFLKIDVEGAEKLVLDGASSLLARAADRFTILFEGFDRNTAPFGYTVRDLFHLLDAHGFSVHGFDSALQLRPLAELGPAVGSTIYNFVAYKKPPA